MWEDVLQIAGNREKKCVFVYKDLHLDNLTWVPGRAGMKQIGIFDFQDAKYGSAVYDIMSLLDDPRYPMDDRGRTPLIERYLARVSPTMRELFSDQYAVYAAQRAFKILGNIAYLASSCGKTRFLEFTPSVTKSLRRQLQNPLLSRIRDFVDEQQLLA